MTQLVRYRSLTFASSLCLLTAALSAVPCAAANPLPKESPTSPAAAMTLQYARQDADQWQARAAELGKQLADSRDRVKVVTDTLSLARKQLQSVDQQVTAAQAGLQSLLPPGTRAKPLSTAKSEPPKAAPVPEAAPSEKSPPPTAPKVNEAAIATAREALQKILEQQTQLRKQLTKAEHELKQSQTSQEALAKAHQEAESLQKQAAERVTLLAKLPQTAKPENARLIQTFAAPRPVLTARWDHNGRGFFAGIQGSDVLRYDVYRSGFALPTNDQARPAHFELKGHHSWVGSLAVAPSGAELVSGSYNGHLIWWNTLADPPSLVRDRVAHQGFVRAVACSPDGQLVASCGNDQIVRVWNSSGTLVRELKGHASHIYNVAFHPSGKSLVSGDLMGILKQWDTSNWQLIRELDAKVLEKYDETFRAHCGGIRSLDFSPDGRLLVVSGVSDVTNAFAAIGVPTAVLFDWQTGKQLRILKPQNAGDGSCWGIRFSPAGDFIVGCGGRGSGTLWFWKPSDEKSFFDLRLPNVPYDLQFHPDGLRLLLPMYDATIRVYDLGPKAEIPPSTETRTPGKKDATRDQKKKLKIAK